MLASFTLNNMLREIRLVFQCHIPVMMKLELKTGLTYSKRISCYYVPCLYIQNGCTKISGSLVYKKFCFRKAGQSYDPQMIFPYKIKEINCLGPKYNFFFCSIGARGGFKLEMAASEA